MTEAMKLEGRQHLFHPRNIQNFRSVDPFFYWSLKQYDMNPVSFYNHNSLTLMMVWLHLTFSLTAWILSDFKLLEKNL